MLIPKSKSWSSLTRATNGDILLLACVAQDEFSWQIY